ncbi:DUF6918 family protein [Serinicoccus kebangsaanensis]|uniref:DUF6918 family protein n=1 Tax=Serinicoccus kebangsaanensis TaxID=2602069 RepID=UPI00124DC4CB|nr:hypothetical protein [Serinicoccus kebangsaanensis]
MSTLSTALLEPSTRPRVVDALLVLADAEISTKKGISGTMLKTAFSGARKASESNVRKGVDRLLPGVARALDPHFDAKGDVAFGTYLSDPARSGQVADELLAVADSAAARVEGNPLGKVYASFRGRAKEHVVAALPRLGATLETFAH